MDMPKFLNVNGIDYVRCSEINNDAKSLKPYSYVYFANTHLYLSQVCPNDFASWGNVGISEKYRFCPTCGERIDRDCYLARLKKFKEMEKSGDIKEGYVFGDDE